MAFVTGAVLLSFALTALLPDDARLWGTLALSALGLGSFLLGAATLYAAKLRGEP